MSQYFNKNSPFFDNTSGSPLAFGVIYFGQPNTDPKDQVNNAKAPYTDRALTTPTDSMQTLDSAGKLENRLYLSGACSVTVTDANGVDISVNPYYVGESSDQVVNDSNVTGANLTAALNNLQTRIAALESGGAQYADIYPVGALYLTTVNENPGSRLGIGTWSAYAQGRVIVGIGAGTDSNSVSQTFTAGQTSGTYTHTLTVDQMPSHSHYLFSGGTQSAANTTISGTDVVAREFADTGNNDQYIMKTAATQVANTGLSRSAGMSQAHTNTQPSIAVYIWRRTA